MGTTFLIALIFGIAVFGVSAYTIYKSAKEETQNPQSPEFGKKPSFSYFVPTAFGVGAFLGVFLIDWLTSL